MFLYVHHHIREDAQTLFGFLRRDERAAFDILIATHGVGPALAVAILGTHSPTALRRHRRRQRSRRAHASCPASARRRPSACWSSCATGSTCRCSIRSSHRRAGSTAVGNVREALAGLGYAPEEIREAMRELSDDATSAEGLLRDALAAAGGATCVRSSSIHRPPTTSKRPTRRACGRGASTSSSARAS